MALEQHGEFDWVNLNNTAVSTVSQIAQRLAMAGVSPTTYQAGIVMFSKVRLGPMGSERVLDVLNQLRPCYGLGGLLWIGFGHKTFLAQLTETAAGFTCVAFCACLVETYGLDRAAMLLQALWRFQELEDSSEPSRQQFGALANACSGVLIASQYPNIVRHFTRPLNATIRSVRCEDWAKAVNAIFQISKGGGLQAIKIYGGRDLAFLGAIAQWLFDLDVCINSPDGTHFHSTCLYPEHAKVYLQFTDMRRSSALIHISATTFMLRKVEDLILDDPKYTIYCRVPWRRCLADLFYEEVNDILREAILLGRAAGAVARLYQALHECEEDVQGLSRTHFVNFTPSGHGVGYIDNMCNLFPEISSNSAFREAAAEILDMDAPGCTQVLVRSIEKLAASCCCRECLPKGNHFFETGRQGRVSRCNVAVFCFIRTVSDIVAHLDFQVPIDPSQHGLVYTYHCCLQERCVRLNPLLQHSNVL